MQLKSCFDRQCFHEKTETKDADRGKAAVSVAFGFFCLFCYVVVGFFFFFLNTVKEIAQKALG